MARRALPKACLILSFLFCLSPWASPAAAQLVPNGYQLITDPQGTAAMIVAQRPARSATAALAQGIAEVATAFDAKPTLLGAFRDVRDQTAEAGFRTTLRRVPVSGIAFADFSGGVARVGFAFDNAQAPAAGILRLLQQAGHIPAGSGGATGASPGNWRTVQYPDGSGTVRLPEGWQIGSAVKGAMDAAGPQGRIFKAISIQCMTRAGAAQTEQIHRMSGMHPQLIAQNLSRMIIADPGDPVSTMVAVETQNSAKYGDGSYRFLRTIQASPVQPPPGMAQAAFIDYEFMLKGVRERSFAYVAYTGDFGNGTWGFYTSGLTSRSEAFARNFSLLYEILLSAQTAQHTIQERWDSALNSQREIGEISRQVYDNRSRSSERIHADRIEALQGRRIVRDSATGQTGTANLGYSREVVQSLNKQAGWARYQEIPLKDLVR